METLTRKATVADYLQLPEGGRYQLINGEIMDFSPTFCSCRKPMRQSSATMAFTARLILIVEILSPSTSYYDTKKKFRREIGKLNSRVLNLELDFAQ